jgi:hypothetical protein
VDANIFTELAGVLGSVTGAAAAIATTWISQKSRTVRERAKWEARKRETEISSAKHRIWSRMLLIIPLSREVQSFSSWL